MSSLSAAMDGAPAHASAADPVIAAAGDIACDPSNGKFQAGAGTIDACRQKYTSDLLVNMGLSAVLDLGDNQYECGGYNAFLQSYDLSWGRLKAITHPSVGNHEYITSTSGTDCSTTYSGADGYFRYFGAAAGQKGQGYYSYDIGSWHLIALNSNCGDIGGCAPGTPEGDWLSADLAAHSNFCTLAYWHIPLYSSGGRPAQNSKTFWQALYNSNADLILNGHDHIYERFAPQNASGMLDTVRGIRQFTVGTGGANHTTITGVITNSEVINASTFGVLKLTLHPGSYDWQFVPEAGGTFTDSGSQTCHGANGVTATPTATAASTATSTPTPTNTPVATLFQPALPIQAGFFYPTYPQAWTQAGIYPYTIYTPTLGFYSSTDNATIDAQLNWAARAHLKALIASWAGQASTSDSAFAYILNRSQQATSPYPNLRWTIYYEAEGVIDPTADQIASDLNYLNLKYFGQPGYLRVNGKPVVFVHGGAADNCGMADRWAQAKAQVGGTIYLVLKVFSGYKTCANQPDAWHQYNPAVNYDAQLPYAVSISPGYAKVGETARLARDPVRFEADVQKMLASGASWQLVTTWNEWSEGTSVEPALSYGTTYVDILCRNLPGSTSCGSATPTPTFTPASTNTPTATNTPTPTATNTPVAATLSFAPVADSYVNSDLPTSNFGTWVLRVDASPDIRSYLRFNVQGVSGTLKRVTLRVYANSANSIGYDARGVSDNTWGESSLTYNNAPPMGGVIRSSGPFAAGNWTAVDITPLVTGNGAWSVGLTTASGTSVSLASRETASNAPQLVVEYSMP